MRPVTNTILSGSKFLIVCPVSFSVCPDDGMACHEWCHGRITYPWCMLSDAISQPHEYHGLVESDPFLHLHKIFNDSSYTISYK